MDDASDKVLGQVIGVVGVQGRDPGGVALVVLVLPLIDDRSNSLVVAGNGAVRWTGNVRSRDLSLAEGD